MPGATYGQGFIDLTPRLEGRAMSAFGSSFTSAMGPIATAAGAALAVGIGAALAAGVGLLKLGATFDDAFDTIRVGTGATGVALGDLQDSFRDVVRDVPTDFGSAATAVAGLNTRLGLTGDDLEATAAQMLEMTRLTGGDLASNITEVSRVFGDWGVATDDQGARMDQLFRASQATGIGVDDLSSQLVKFGAPLRQLGFGFEESAALISAFEKEGVNGELVMGSMRIALGKLARAGEPAEETFRRVTDQIADAGSTSEANALALELFGARAGPDMAAAIREGRFEVGDLIDQIASGEDTIRGAAADTEDWRQKWDILKNRTLVALEPLAASVFGAMGSFMEQLAPKAEALAVWLGENIPRAVDFLRGVFEQVAAVVGPIVDGITTVVGGFRTAVTDDSSAISQIITTLGDTFRGIFDAIRGVVEGAMNLIQAIIEKVWPIISRIWEQHGERILAFVTGTFDRIKRVIQSVLGIIRGIFDAFAAIFRGDWSALKDALSRIWSALWDGIKAILEQAWEVLVSAFEVGKTLLKEAWQAIWDSITRIAAGVWEDAKEWGSNIVEGIWDGIKSMGSWLKEKLLGWVGDHIPGPIASALGIRSPSKLMAELGRQIPLGLAVGMDATTPTVVSAAERVARATVPSLTLLQGGLSDVAGSSSGGQLFRDLNVTSAADPEDIAAAIAWKRRAAGV